MVPGLENGCEMLKPADRFMPWITSRNAVFPVLIGQ